MHGKNSKIGIIFIFFILFTLTSTVLFAQSRKTLERKIKKQEQALRLTTKLLKETKKKKKESYNKFLLIQNQIRTREELLKNLLKDIELLNNKISENEEIVNSLKNDLETLKEQYAKLITFAWKNRSSYQQLMFILSSENFNQAFMRIRYLQQLTNYRKKEANAIKDILLLLESKVKELNNKKQEKKNILKRIEEERIVLANEKQEQSRTVEKLKQKEKDLLVKLQKQRKAAEILKKKIAKIIADEARKAREAARKKHPKTKPDKTKNFILTPEEKIIAANFAANKGHLPWPTVKGIITGTFGTHEHPLIKGIKINNDGIYISVPEGSKVRAIFKGEVRKVFEIPGKHKLVLIRHGDYFSVYAGLSEVYVKEGEKVKTKQEIGKVYTDTEEHKTVLELQIWKGSVKVNPQYWLARH